MHIPVEPVLWQNLWEHSGASSALIVGGWAVAQLWLFWVAALIGAALAGVAYRFVAGERTHA